MIDEFRELLFRRQRAARKFLLIAFPLVWVWMIGTELFLGAVNPVRDAGARNASLWILFGGGIACVAWMVWTAVRRARKYGLSCPSCGRPLAAKAMSVAISTGKCAMCQAPFFEADDAAIAALRPELCRRGKFSLGDLPLICMTIGPIAALLSVACLLDNGWEISSPIRLVNISGRVTAIYQTTMRSPYGRMLRIEVDEPFRRWHLIQFDLLERVPALNALRLGDSIVAVAQNDPFHRDLAWYYEIHVGDKTLLSYEQTVGLLSQRERATGRIAGSISIVLLVLGLAIRLGTGRWMKPVTLEPEGRAASLPRRPTPRTG